MPRTYSVVEWLLCVCVLIVLLNGLLPLSLATLAAGFVGVVALFALAYFIVAGVKIWVSQKRARRVSAAALSAVVPSEDLQAAAAPLRPDLNWPGKPSSRWEGGWRS